jgi:hypothetical protein
LGWLKTLGLLHKLRHRDGEPVTFATAAYNPVRLRTLIAST